MVSLLTSSRFSLLPMLSISSAMFSMSALDNLPARSKDACSFAQAKKSDFVKRGHGIGLGNGVHATQPLKPLVNGNAIAAYVLRRIRLQGRTGRVVTHASRTTRQGSESGGPGSPWQPP